VKRFPAAVFFALAVFCGPGLGAEEAGAEPSAGELAGRLYDAAAAGNTAELNRALEAGAPVDTIPFMGWSAFHRAADMNSPEMLELFLNHGAAPDALDEHGETILMRAAGVSGNKTALLGLIIAAGADPNRQNGEGQTALMYGWDPGSLEFLLDAGADPLIRDRQGKTVLHYSARRNDWSAAAFLIRRGIPVDAEDNGGLTPLMEAVDYSPRRHKEIILGLLEAGADPRRLFPGGKTVLQRYLEDFGEGSWFNREPSLEVVRKLLDAGVDPGQKDEAGNSALYLALGHENDRDIDSRVIDVIRAAARPEDLAALSPQLRRNRARIFNREKLPALIPALALPLGFSGLSIAMREGVYRDDPGANWMLPVNSFLALGPGAGAVSAAAAGGLIYIVNGGDSKARSTAIAAGAAAGVTGFIAGAVVSFIPAVREAFVEYPGLYYLPSALAAAAGGVVFLRVLLK
jgi:ankyrin repeat protein